MGQQSAWPVDEKRNTRKARWILIVVATLVLVGIVGGVSYVLLHKGGANSGTAGSADGTNDGGTGGGNNNNNNGKGNGNGNNGNNGNGTNSPPNPSAKYYTWDNKLVDLNIVPNPQLKKSLYGINYGPVNATFPWCTNTLGDVIEDVKLISQLTNRIRLYGMDCNAANYTLLAIKILGLKMHVIPTVWVDDNMTTYQRQYNDLFNNLKYHGFDSIEGISVGNEVIFRKEIQPSDLYARIADVRTKARAMSGCPPNMPVFTSDLGSNVDTAFVSAVDVAFANVHPYFGGVSVSTGASWTFQFFEENDVAPAAKQKKTAVMSEVGWPTAGPPQDGAVASIPNLQTFLSTFICAANSKGYPYYYFETFDTPWKTAQFGLLEGSWGLFSPDRSLKPSITIPDCQPTAPGLLGPNS